MGTRKRHRKAKGWASQRHEGLEKTKATDIAKKKRGHESKTRESEKQKEDGSE